MAGTQADPELAQAYAYDASLPLDAESRILHDEPTLRAERFEFSSAGGERVAGIFLTDPSADGPRPLVLVGHPGTLDKASDYVLRPAQLWVREGAVCATIDQAGHGERADGPVEMSSFRDPQRRLRETVQTAIDWRRALDYLQHRPEVDAARVGFVGFSMGGMRGAPFVGLDERVRAGVFCIAGATMAPGDDPALAQLTDPARFGPLMAGRETLIVAGLHDDVVTPESAQRFHDAVGAPRQIEWLPCGHWDFMPQGLAPIAPFLKRTILA